MSDMRRSGIKPLCAADQFAWQDADCAILVNTLCVPIVKVVLRCSRLPNNFLSIVLGILLATELVSIDLMHSGNVLTPS